MTALSRVLNPLFDGSYPLVRPLFLYVKVDHLERKPELAQFISFFVSEDVMGSDGFLSERGLVPLADSEYLLVREAVANRDPVRADSL